jgi:hypothetical protein
MATDDEQDDEVDDDDMINEEDLYYDQDLPSEFPLLKSTLQTLILIFLQLVMMPPVRTCPQGLGGIPWSWARVPTGIDIQACAALSQLILPSSVVSGRQVVRPLMEHPQHLSTFLRFMQRCLDSHVQMLLGRSGFRPRLNNGVALVVRTFPEHLFLLTCLQICGTCEDMGVQSGDNLTTRTTASIPFFVVTMAKPEDGHLVQRIRT